MFVRQPNSTILTAHWDSVFSLDLNDTEPDIVYEFEVYDITCGRNDLIHNNTVMANSTSNTIDPTQLYKVVVAARNNVANAVKGTGADVSGMWLNYYLPILLFIKCVHYSFRDILDIELEHFI